MNLYKACHRLASSFCTVSTQLSLNWHGLHVWNKAHFHHSSQKSNIAKTTAFMTQWERLIRICGCYENHCKNWVCDSRHKWGLGTMPSIKYTITSHALSKIKCKLVDTFVRIFTAVLEYLFIWMGHFPWPWHATTSGCWIKEYSRTESQLCYWGYGRGHRGWIDSSTG